MHFLFFFKSGSLSAVKDMVQFWYPQGGYCDHFNIHEKIVSQNIFILI